MHVFPLASRSGSGIETRVWLEGVAAIHELEESENCPAFCYEDGYQLTENFVEDSVLHPILEDLQKSGWFLKVLRLESSTGVSDRSGGGQKSPLTMRACLR